VLLDPVIVVDHAGLVIAVVLAVIVGKGLITVMIALAFPYPARTALFAGAGLAQIGEFSFIIAQSGFDAELLQESTYNVILVAAVISISVNPLTFKGIPFWERLFQRLDPFWAWANRQGPIPTDPPRQHNHVIIAGYGRVGELTGHSLLQLELPYTVIEADFERVRRLTGANIAAIWGDSSNAEVLKLAGIERCRLMAVCVPDESTCLLTVAAARKLNESVPIIVRARHGDEIPILRELGANHIVVPEYEGGIELMRQSLVSLGFDMDQAGQYADAIRDIHYGEGHAEF
jgi:CPA2 family monovalent cation:H+ antiporter-2